MLPEPIRQISYDHIAATAGAHAAEHDRDGSFPAAAFDGLRDLGLIAHPPLRREEATTLFQILAAVGHGDLSVGRIFEGHVNALFLIQHFGTSSQRKQYFDLASDGHIFGVWNTDMPDEPVVLKGTRLKGRKTFASGVDGLSYAIITSSALEGRLMIVIPVGGLPVDRTWWRPLGMRASGSHVVTVEGCDIDPNWILGRYDDYTREPWFSAGAFRFAAVHVGGMHAVFDAAIMHLRATRRTQNPYQLHHMGRMGIAVETGYAWLDRAAKVWAKADGNMDTAIVATANAARLAIESLALVVLETAERSVGAGGLIAPNPLERLARDLRTYLRQPNPDGALASLGTAIAENDWSPGRSFNAISDANG